MSVAASSKAGLLGRVDRHLVAAAAAAGAMGAVASSADAAIIYSGPKNIVVPQTADGLYVDLVTGVTGTSAAATPGADFNLFTVAGTGLYGDAYNYLYNFSPGSTTAVPLGALVSSTAAGPSISKLAAGASISSAGLFDNNDGLAGQYGTYPATGAWLPPTSGFMGLKFLLNGTAAYAWVSLNITGTANNAQATITGWAYEDTGAAIAAGAGVPEPTSVSLLAAGAAGLVAWRRRKPMAA